MTKKIKRVIQTFEKKAVDMDIEIAKIIMDIDSEDREALKTEYYGNGELASTLTQEYEGDKVIRKVYQQPMIELIETTEITYYHHGQIKSSTCTDSDGDTLQEEYEYDDQERLVKLHTIDPNGTMIETMVYDSNNNLVAETTRLNSDVEITEEHEYDSMGNRIYSTASDGDNIYYEEKNRYNDANQLIESISYDHRAFIKTIIEQGYNPDGKKSWEKIYANDELAGTKTYEYSQEAPHELIKITTTGTEHIISEFTYEYYE